MDELKKVYNDTTEIMNNLKSQLDAARTTAELTSSILSLLLLETEIKFGKIKQSYEKEMSNGQV